MKQFEPEDDFDRKNLEFINFIRELDSKKATEGLVEELFEKIHTLPEPEKLHSKGDSILLSSRNQLNLFFDRLGNSIYTSSTAMRFAVVTGTIAILAVTSYFLFHTAETPVYFAEPPTDSTSTRSSSAQQKRQVASRKPEFAKRKEEPAVSDYASRHLQSILEELEMGTYPEPEPGLGIAVPPPLNDSIESHIRWIEYYVEYEDYERAKGILKSGIGFDSGDAGLYSAGAQIFVMEQRFDAAVGLFWKAGQLGLASAKDSVTKYKAKILR